MKNIAIQGALLEILSHDLLAPVTAVKWQLELLERDADDHTKREKYIHGMRDSAEISIALLQYVATTGAVLRGEHTSEKKNISISDVLEHAWRHIEPQYGRHGVLLDISCEAECGVRPVDVRLMQVFVWVVAKFFLASAVVRDTVQVRGFCLKNESGEEVGYIMTVSAPRVTNATTYQKAFNDPSRQILLESGSPVHADVFAELIRVVAKEAGILFSAGIETDVFTFEASMLFHES